MDKDSANALVDLLRAKAPEYIDLLTARTLDQFESAFDAILGHAVDRLQKNAKHFGSLDEEGLTGVMAGYLEVPGLSVSQESHSNGHVDLHIEANHCSPPRIKLAEAKMYKGPAYHFKGLKQLLSYTTGAETTGLLLVYVCVPDILALVKRLRDKADTDRPQKQIGPATNHTLNWSFCTKHNHRSKENMKVAHVCCNLYCE